MHKIMSVGFLLVLCLISTPKAQSEDWVYSVRKGDTLWDLCLKYTLKKNCWIKIGPYNEVEYPPSLLPGTRIRIPVDWLKARPSSVKVIHAQGDVVVSYDSINETNSQTNSQTNSSTTQPIQKGDELNIGASIQTGPGSNASLKFADGTVLVLEENSHLVLNKLSQHGAYGMADSILNLYKGSAKSKVSKQSAQSRFEVSTPSAVAAVRGTEFRITAQDSQSMLGEVFEGTVAITKQDNSQSLDLKEGYGIKVDKSQKQLQAIPLLPAPQWNTPEIFDLHRLLEWEKVAGAKNYRLQLLANNDDDILISSTTTEKTESMFPTTEPGCYKLQLNAIREEGLLGMPTKTSVCAAYKPAAPKITLDSSGTITWGAIENTVTYQVQISEDRQFKNLIKTLPTEQTSAPLPTLEKQKVFIKVTPVGKYKIIGEDSNIISTAKEDGIYVFLSLFTLALVLLL